MMERVKSWVLSLLVVASLFLTWQLWTYQPNYALLDEQDYVQSENVGAELSLHDVIWPEQMVMHKGNQITSMNGSDRLFSVFYRELLDSRFEEITLQQDADLDQLLSGERVMEIIFPTAIPASILNKVLSFEMDMPQLSIDTVDRIILLDEGGDIDHLTVKFISFHEGVVLEGETNFSVSNFRNRYFAQTEQFPNVFAYTLNESAKLPKTLYLPKEPVTLDTISDTSTPIDYHHFLRVLFSDIDSVKQYYQDNRESSFTDGNRMMSLEGGGSYLTYVHPIYSETPNTSQQHVIQTTFDFINSYGGWTDNYRLYDWNVASQEENATYRMIIDGLPVFESRGRDLASIHVTRSGGQVTEFSRPLYNLDQSPLDAKRTMELPAGQDILNYVEEKFGPQEIENIRIGYKMDRTDHLVIHFEPSWYVQVDGSWYSVDPND